MPKIFAEDPELQMNIIDTRSRYCVLRNSCGWGSKSRKYISYHIAVLFRSLFACAPLHGLNLLFQSRLLYVVSCHNLSFLYVLEP